MPHRLNTYCIRATQVLQALRGLGLDQLSCLANQIEVPAFGSFDALTAKQDTQEAQTFLQWVCLLFKIRAGAGSRVAR